MEGLREAGRIQSYANLWKMLKATFKVVIEWLVNFFSAVLIGKLMVLIGAFLLLDMVIHFGDVSGIGDFKYSQCFEYLYRIVHSVCLVWIFIWNNEIRGQMAVKFPVLGRLLMDCNIVFYGYKTQCSSSESQAREHYIYILNGVVFSFSGVVVEAKIKVYCKVRK